MSTDTQNTMDFGFLGNQSAKDVVDAQKSSTFPRLALCQITQAIVNQAESGTTTIDISFQTLNPDTKEVEKNYNLETKYLVGSEGKVNANHKKEQAFVNNIRYITGTPENTPPKIGLANGKVWDKDAKAFIDKQVPQLLDILGKLFYANIACYNKHPMIYVNGYSGIEITSYSENPELHKTERESAETVQVYNYNADTRPNIQIWGIFDLNTKQNLAEKMEGKEPEFHVTQLDDMKTKNFTQEKKSDEEQREYRLSKLKAKLGKEFNQARFDSFNGNVSSAMKNQKKNIGWGN